MAGEHWEGKKPPFKQVFLILCANPSSLSFIKEAVCVVLKLSQNYCTGCNWILRQLCREEYCHSLYVVHTLARLLFIYPFFSSFPSLQFLLTHQIRSGNNIS